MKRTKLLLAVIPLLFSSGNAQSAAPLKAKPLFEVGGGVVGADFPDYPGADHNRRVYLPFPSVVFRGDILRAKKDEGVRGRFINKEWIEFDLSADGTFPSKAGDNKAREGMPDLDAVLELGPSVIIHLLKRTHARPYTLDFHFATRYIFSSDIKTFDDRGLAFNPFFNFKYDNFLQNEGMLLFSAGVKFATYKLMKYYYGVDSEYATASRAAYNAHSGYMETSLALGLFQPIKNDIWVMLGIVKPFHHGAANERSPLLVKRATTSILLGFYWNFYKSEIQVLDTN